MRIFVKALAIVCVGLMVATAFQTVSACGGGGRDQWDFVVDSFGWIHGVFVMPYRPGHHQPMNHEVFYTDNVGGQWHDPLRISDSPEKSSYPQIGIDSELGIMYVTWLEDGPHDRPVWYAGSPDGVRWSAPHPSDVTVSVGGNPHIDMSADDGVLELVWKHGGNAIIIADLDFDMIPDYRDERLLDFDIEIGVPFDADLVEYSSETGVVVAIDFVLGSGTVLISPVTPSVLMGPSTQQYFNVAFSGSAEYTAIVKDPYNPAALPADILPEHLRMYWLNDTNWTILMAPGESTGVNTVDSYVWASLGHLSTFVSGDATKWDSEGDGLTDGVEMNIDGATPQTITEFESIKSLVTMVFTTPGEQETFIRIPIQVNTNPSVDISWFDIEGALSPFSDPVDIISAGAQPCIWGDKLAWRDYNSNAIMLKNLVDGTVEQVSASSHPGIDGSPAMWDDWVAWVRDTPPPPPYPGHSLYTIMAWNENAKEEVILGGGSDIDLWGTKLVGLTDLGLTLYDLGTQQVTYLAGSGNYYAPKIWNTFVGYVHNVPPSPTYSIEWFDTITGLTHVVASGLTNPILDLAGTKIAYSDVGGTGIGSVIHVHDIVTGQEDTISASVSKLILSEDSLYWYDGSEFITRYDLWTQESAELASIANPSNLNLAADTDRLVWSAGAPGSIKMVEQMFRQIAELRVGDEPTPSWSSSGWGQLGGKPEISYLANAYVRDNLVTGATYIDVPLKIKAHSRGTITLSGLNTVVSFVTTFPVSQDTDTDGMVDGWIDEDKDGIYDPDETPGEWPMATDPNRQEFVGTATSRDVAGEVDAFNGNLRIRRPLLSVGAGSGKIDFSIVYNSQRRSDISVIGSGWTSPFFASITTDASGNAIYRNGEGDEYMFKVYANGYYSTPPGFVGHLVYRFWEAGPWRLSFPDGSLHTFIPAGKLQRMEDNNGRGLTLNYGGSGQLLSIVADAGTRLDLAYVGAGITQLASIADEIGRTVQLGHAGSWGLASITDAAGYATTFQYESLQRYLMRSVAPWGLATEYNYNFKSASLVQVTSIVQGTNSAGVTLDPVTIARFTYTYPKTTNDMDALDGSSTTTFDRLGRVKAFSDPVGILTSYTNDYHGQQVSYVDGRGYTRLTAYDSFGNVARIEQPNGAIIANEYLTKSDASRSYTLLRREIAENGGVTMHWYDGSGNEIRASDRERAEAVSWFDADGRVVEQRGLTGAMTLYKYDAWNNLIRSTDALEGVTTWTHDLVGRRLSEKNANGFTHSYTYTALDQVSTITDPFGFVEHKWYDADGNLVSEKDKKGFYTNYTHDVFGRQLTVKDKLGYITTNAYDDLGRLISTTNAREYSTIYTYDASGRMIATMEPLGYTTTYAYDDNGNQISRTDPLGHTWTKTYDEMNRVAFESDPLGNSVSYVYDVSGNTIEQTDALENSWTYGYDELNRRVAESDPLGATTSYGYDANGNLVSVTDANGHTWKYQYDLLNRKTTETTPLGNVWSFGYDAVGNQVSRTDANGATTTYKYCALDRVVRTNYTDGTYVVTGYNVCYCDPTSETYYAPGGTVISGFVRSIDALGRPVTVTTNYGTFQRSVSYAYDEVGNVVTVTTDGRAITYLYDGNDRVISITDPTMGHVEYQIDAAGRTASRSFEGLTTTYAYDGANRLTLVSTTYGSSTWTYSYQYDANGRRTSMTEQNPIWGTGIHAYAYDAVGRLQQVSYPWGESKTYTYDPVGNRLSESTGKPSRTFTYDDENRLISSKYTEIPGGYPIHTWVWEYDNNGNQVAQTVINGTSGPYYTYDYENRLTLVQQGDPENPEPVVSFAFLSNGDRISRADHAIGETIYYLYDREDVIAIMDNTGAPIQNFLHGIGADEPVALRMGANVYYYVQDGLGSTVALINVADGSVAAAYLYDAWGNIKESVGPLAQLNPYLFTSRECDWQTGIYYYRARSYDAALGRFLQRDPKGMVDGSNMYVYVGNDPINKVDPKGKLIFLAWGILITVAIIIFAYVWYCIWTQGRTAETNNPYYGQTNADKYEHCVWTCLMRRNCGLSYDRARTQCGNKEWWDRTVKGQSRAASNCDMVANECGQWTYMYSGKTCKAGCQDWWPTLRLLSPGSGYC